MDLETLREYCLSLPGVTKEVKWGADLCFLVGGKMFCVTGFEELAVSLKVNEAEFEELCARPGIVPPPYLARAKWVLVKTAAALSDKEWKERIKISYEFIKVKLSAAVRKKLAL